MAGVWTPAHVTKAYTTTLSDDMSNTGGLVDKDLDDAEEGDLELNVDKLNAGADDSVVETDVGDPVDGSKDQMQKVGHDWPTNPTNDQRNQNKFESYARATKGRVVERNGFNNKFKLKVGPSEFRNLVENSKYTFVPTSGGWLMEDEFRNIIPNREPTRAELNKCVGDNCDPKVKAAIERMIEILSNMTPEQAEAAVFLVQEQEDLMNLEDGYGDEGPSRPFRMEESVKAKITKFIVEAKSVLNKPNAKALLESSWKKTGAKYDHCSPLVQKALQQLSNHTGAKLCELKT